MMLWCTETLDGWCGAGASCSCPSPAHNCWLYVVHLLRVADAPRPAWGCPLLPVIVYPLPICLLWCAVRGVEYPKAAAGGCEECYTAFSNEDANRHAHTLRCGHNWCPLCVGAMRAAGKAGVPAYFRDQVTLREGGFWCLVCEQPTAVVFANNTRLVEFLHIGAPAVIGPHVTHNPAADAAVVVGAVVAPDAIDGNRGGIIEADAVVAPDVDDDDVVPQPPTKRRLVDASDGGDEGGDDHDGADEVVWMCVHHPNVQATLLCTCNLSTLCDQHDRRRGWGRTDASGCPGAGWCPHDKVDLFGDKVADIIVAAQLKRAADLDRKADQCVAVATATLANQVSAVVQVCEASRALSATADEWVAEVKRAEREKLAELRVLLEQGEKDSQTTLDAVLVSHGAVTASAAGLRATVTRDLARARTHLNATKHLLSQHLVAPQLEVAAVCNGTVRGAIAGGMVINAKVCGALFASCCPR